MGMVSLAAVLTIATAALLGSSAPIDLPLRLWLFGSVYLGVARVMLLSVRRQAVRNPALATPTLVIGAGAVGEHLVRRLYSDPRYGLRPVGFLDSDPPPSSDLSSAPVAPLLGGTKDLADTIAATEARHVILAFASEPDHRLLKTVKRVPGARPRGVARPAPVRVGQRPLQLEPRRRAAAARAATDRSQGWQFAVKHSVDRVFARADTVRAAAGADRDRGAVKLESPGPSCSVSVGSAATATSSTSSSSVRCTVGPVRAVQAERRGAPGGVEGADRRTRRDAPAQRRSTSCRSCQRGARRHEPRRPAARAARVRGAVRGRVRPLLGSPSGEVGDHRLGAGPRASRPDLARRSRRVGQLLHRHWSLRLDARIVALTIAEILRFRG